MKNEKCAHPACKCEAKAEHSGYCSPQCASQGKAGVQAKPAGHGGSGCGCGHSQCR
jgi:hypothetical protein